MMDIHYYGKKNNTDTALKLYYPLKYNAWFQENRYK